MKAVHALLKLLVLVGCLALLAKTPRSTTVRADADCQTFATTKTTYNCPSGCTSPTYSFYLPLGGGMSNATTNPDPCLPSSCTQPGNALNQPSEDCSVCGIPLGDQCGSGGQNVCCKDSSAICGANGLCCLENGTFGCSSSLDCCNGTCSSDTCCVGFGQSCTSDNECCGDWICLGGTCSYCIATGQYGCYLDSDCCNSGDQCPDFWCCTPDGGPCFTNEYQQNYCCSGVCEDDRCQST